MKLVWRLLALTLCVLVRRTFAQADGSLDVVPFICKSSPYVVLGTPFQWQNSKGMTGENCSLWSTDSDRLQNDSLYGSTFKISEPGLYKYDCPGMVSHGNLTIVVAQYSIVICDGCSNHSNIYTINPGDSVEWTFIRLAAAAANMETLNCTTLITNNGEQLEVLNPSIHSYQFSTPGTYQVLCRENTSVNSTILVSSLPAITKYSPLLYIHAALMAIAFGFILPIGGFLASINFTPVHKFLQPLGILLALIGFVLIIVYVQLSKLTHFKFLLHSLLGLALMILVLAAMPLLLFQKSRAWHKRTGHVVAFFGLGNVLLGLTALSIPFIPAITICSLYGLWLLISLTFYVLYPRARTTSSYINQEFIEVDSITPGNTRNASFSSVSSKGPLRLEKNIIGEDKMIELRKKSMDFLDTKLHREQLNLEFKHHPLYNKPLPLYNKEGLEEEVVAYGEERRGSKPDQDSPDINDLENSQVPLCPSFQQKNSLSPPPEASNGRVDMYLADSDDDDVDEPYPMEEDAPHQVALQRANTFHHGGTIHSSFDFNNDSDPETQRGGSLRITRHSQRARKPICEVFEEPASSANLQLSAQDTPMAEPPSSVSLPAHLVSQSPSVEQTQERAPSVNGRRRKGAFLPPPIITTTSVETIDGPSSECQFNAGLSVGVRNATYRRGSSQSSCTGSPTPSGDSSMFDSKASPRPLRKKKVSVAHIEATVVPPTPITLQPPSSLTRSASQEALRTHHDVFTDNALRSVMQISQDAIVCANSVGDIVFWSVGASKIFGYTPGEAAGGNLEMIIPMSFKERHRCGINKRTCNTLKYVRKHSYAPEEQKHARLYEVRGLTKSGNEIPVEVHVTSFVIEGELFYTGVISEMSRKGGELIGSTSDINELSLKQRSMAVGAQMKMAHNLMRADQISKRELERVLVTSLKATDFEVGSDQIELMIAGIIKEGDPGTTGSISFVNLIKLLSKHQLYISESGNIARYGKTKGVEGGNLSRGHRYSNRVKDLFTSSASVLLWLLVYIVFNTALFVIGVTSTHTEKEGVARFAFGCGPVLSFNCVIVLLPTLSSFIHTMRNSHWMNKVFPLTKTTLMHVIISCGIMFWTAIHVALHLTSFGVDKSNATTSLSVHDRFTTNLKTNIFPFITGLIALIVFATMGLTSVKPLRRLFQFIPFFLIHWFLLGFFYVLMFIHGVTYINPSFWKWLLPLFVIAVCERIYRYVSVTRYTVKVKSAGRYDDQSRTGIIELEKPKWFKFEPGQFILLNLPWIGRFKWQPCQIGSAPKDKTITIHIPHSTDIWFSQVFQNLKDHPCHMPKPISHKNDDKTKNNPEEFAMETTEPDHPADRAKIQFSGPYGPTINSKLLFDFKISTLVCGGNTGPICAKAIIKKFLEYRKSASCHCGCTPQLAKLYFIWVVPSGHDFECFTDYLSELCEDDHVHRYLDVRVFLTNINSPPDELASALLQLGLKTAGPHCIVRRPSQPQLNNLHSKTSYGVPDFSGLLDYISAQNAAIWNEKETDFGVFTVGSLHYSMKKDLTTACKKSSKPSQLNYLQYHIDS